MSEVYGCQEFRRGSPARTIPLSGATREQYWREGRADNPTNEDRKNVTFSMPDTRGDNLLSPGYTDILLATRRYR